MNESLNCNILFYVTNGTGVGHLRRISIICKEILIINPKLKIIVVTNASSTTFFESIDIELIYMPHGSIEAELDKKLAKVNYRFLFSKIQKLNPKLVVFDTIFNHITVRNIKQLNIVVVIIQRSITSKYFLCNIEKGYYDFFDKIYFPQDQNSIKDWNIYLKSRIGKRISAEGFIYNNSINNINGKYEIIVSVGGGGEYFTKNENGIQKNDHFELIIRLLNTISKLTPKNIDGKFCFCLGKHIQKHQIEQIQTQFIHNKHIEITNWLPNFQNHLTNCTLLISRCGYNTFCEVIESNCPTIFIPKKSRTESQETRANWLAKKGGALSISEDSEELEEIITAVFNSENYLERIRKKMLNIKLKQGKRTLSQNIINILKTK